MCAVVASYLRVLTRSFCTRPSKCARDSCSNSNPCVIVNIFYKFDKIVTSPNDKTTRINSPYREYLSVSKVLKNNSVKSAKTIVAAPSVNKIVCDNLSDAAPHSMGTTKGLKITVVGDGMVGKTCLLYVYTKNEFPEEYVPTVFDNYVDKITVDGKEVEMALWDTAGQEDYERLRPLSYSSTDCFLVCYSVGTRSSYENVVHKWYPELQHFSSSVPIVLVATKIDLRASGKAVITTQEGKKLKKKIRAAALMECSALERTNIKEVFEEAVRTALKKRPVNKRTCHYL